MSLLVNWNITAEIDITPAGSPTWTAIQAGFDNIAESLNEVLQQYFFLGDGGAGRTFVTGMQPIFTLTGVRKLTDPAQNYIFSSDVKYKLLEDRVTNFRIRWNDAGGTENTITYNDCTLANISDVGGAATDGTAVSVEIHSSSLPVFAGANIILGLTVVSVAGSTAGDTAIYVNPAITGGNIYKYQVGGSALTVVYDQDVSSLTTWNGTDEITAATGQIITLVEATSGNLARKVGTATITSA